MELIRYFCSGRKRIKPDNKILTELFRRNNLISSEEMATKLCKILVIDISRPVLEEEEGLIDLVMWQDFQKINYFPLIALGGSRLFLESFPYEIII
jgi:membrane protein required for beta-lactamase induction